MSEAIRWHLRHSSTWRAGVIKCGTHQTQSDSIRLNQTQSDAIRRNQTQSDAIRRNQTQSDALVDEIIEKLDLDSARNAPVEL